MRALSDLIGKYSGTKPPWRALRLGVGGATENHFIGNSSTTNEPRHLMTTKTAV